MDIIYTYDLHYLIRMLIACICGIFIGFERKNRAKEAGIRTHCIVCCASALMMIISKYAYFDLLGSSEFANMTIKLDPSRVAAGIVSGVGFLGAGMIFVHKQTVTGLTTAAGIWATSGIGMAIGAGMYIVGISATIIIILAQLALHADAKWLKTPKNKKFIVYGVSEKYFQDHAVNIMRTNKISVVDTNVTYNYENGTADYEFIIELPPLVNESELCSLFKYNSVVRTN